MIFGLEHIGALYELALRDYVAASGVPMLMVDYRVAPEHPGPDPDRGLLRGTGVARRECGPDLGVDPARVAVMGDSAGGGLAAGVCLMARDRGGPAVAQQLLIYPMLDDRLRRHPIRRWCRFSRGPTTTTSRGGAPCSGTPRSATDAVSPYAAPARASDLSGLPDTYIDVGDLDVFRDEDVAYARRLADAGGSDRVTRVPRLPARVRGVGWRGGGLSAG